MAPPERPRLTGGSARGRVLPVAVPGSARPTSARVREALFSMIGQDLEGSTVLDAFGGSGLLGLEAWSRGARVTIVERDPAALVAIRHNVSGLRAEVDVRAGDVTSLASSLGRFSIVLVDPPYRFPPGPVVEALVVTVDQWLVLEHASEVEPPVVAGLVVDRRRTYGAAALTLYRREAS